MLGTGHVFVVQGSLTELVCDLALIPTSRGMYVERYWKRYCPLADEAPSADELAAAKARLAAGERVGTYFPARGSRPGFRYIDVGIGRGALQGGVSKERACDWLDDGVQRALKAVAEDVAEGRLHASRVRPLVALPALGTGEGGFDEVRGEVMGNLLRRCEEAVASGGFDIVLVCLHRSDFAFLQRLRSAPGRSALGATQHAQAVQLGTQAAAGRLSLFLGAGVSFAAGAPGFAELVCDVAKALHRPVAVDGAVQAAATAERLRNEVGAAAFDTAVGDVLGRTDTSLLHGLLASTRTAAVMTTNFDDLFERSAAVVFDGAPFDVLPWQRERRTPWFLKMHGSVGRSGRLIITTQDLRDFVADEGALASVVQSQMLLNDVLFVGYSLQDPNVQQLAAGVHELLVRQELDRQTVGTILTIEPLGAAVTELAATLDVVDLYDAGALDVHEAARRLEVFCDVLLWQATKDEPAWQLDERYTVVGQDAELRKKLRDLELPDDGTWTRLRDVLKAYGHGPR